MIEKNPIIELSDLRLELASKAGQVNILRGINLEIATGERVSVVGPSGSGKTSMLMVIAGLERASSGLTRVAGQDLSALDEDALARFRRQHVGIVFQNFHLIPTMTALENVAIPMELAREAEPLDKAREALGAVGLAPRVTHYPAQLSGGEQQRVALARAFVGEPDLLLADEPTGNLDAGTGGKIIDILFDLAESQGTTLLLITHDPALAARCQRQIQLLDGQITGTGGEQA